MQEYNNNATPYDVQHMSLSPRDMPTYLEAVYIQTPKHIHLHQLQILVKDGRWPI